jgi:hypothetical protein
MKKCQKDHNIYLNDSLNTENDIVFLDAYDVRYYLYI